MRREDEYAMIRKYEGPAAEAAARAKDLATELGQPIDLLPAPVETNLEGLIEIVRVMNDPAAAKKRIDELKKATDANIEARKKAEDAIAESHRKLSDHAAKLKADSDAHDSKCAAEREAIAARDAESVKKAHELQAGLEEVAKLKARYEAKLALLKQAEALD
jgi:hypothetical protein